ncbi:MAG: hypothetical protein HUJ65_02250 [Oscillospiraceae bacterium]|nr:hypothetical protein [Oscillospiraceae bacterium]
MKTTLEISDAYDGQYSSSTALSSFSGYLNAVSTNDILLGFRKVYGFTNGSENHLVANLFMDAPSSDYYKTSLFLRSRGAPMKVYLSDMSYTDSDEANPISTAIRVGFAVHSPGQDTDVAAQYIFALNDAMHIENPDYNTYSGSEGYVLDLTSDDTEAVVAFTPYTDASFWTVDPTAGVIDPPGDNALVICELPYEDGTGEPVQVDVYIWLEGCDQDCTNDLSLTSLQDLAISFAGNPS